MLTSHMWEALRNNNYDFIKYRIYLGECLFCCFEIKLYQEIIPFTRMRNFQSFLQNYPILPFFISCNYQQMAPYMLRFKIRVNPRDSRDLEGNLRKPSCYVIAFAQRYEAMQSATQRHICEIKIGYSLKIPLFLLKV